MIRRLGSRACDRLAKPLLRFHQDTRVDKRLRPVRNIESAAERTDRADPAVAVLQMPLSAVIRSGSKTYSLTLEVDRSAYLTAPIPVG